MTEEQIDAIAMLMVGFSRNPNPTIDGAISVLQQVVAESRHFRTAPGAPNTVDLLGVRPDGTTAKVGRVATPLRMKARDIVRDMVGEAGDPDRDDDFDEATQALRCCFTLIDYAEQIAKTATSEGGR